MEFGLGNFFKKVGYLLKRLFYRKFQINMYSIFNNLLHVILLAAAMLFISCQQEEPFQEDIDPVLTLSADSAVIEMMKRTASSDGSYDNIVDGASCLAIQFPYTVTVNGSELGIETVEDFQSIEDIFDATEEAAHNLQITYPITVMLSDYTETVIDSEAVLQDHVERCVEGGTDDDIECVDVVYPVNLFTYNPNLQQTSYVTVNHDRELRRFLAGLDDADLISIDFPLRFEMFDGGEVTVNNNTELAETMDRAAEVCDEDDDGDYNDDDFTKVSLDSMLVTCPWLIKKLNRIDVESSQGYVDITEQYQENLLIFMEDGKVHLDDGFGLVSEGDWSVGVSEFKVFITMEFEDAEAFNSTMYTYVIGEDTIKMDGGENDEIILQRFCAYEMQACSQAFIEENLLTGCRWSITDGEGEFSEAITIDFSQNNILAYNANDIAIDEGSWNISDTTLAFADMSTNLEYYVGDWQIVECSAERFRLERGDETLVLVKNCDAGL